jgi:hypothetical protein
MNFGADTCAVWSCELRTADDVCLVTAIFERRSAGSGMALQKLQMLMLRDSAMAMQGDAAPAIIGSCVYRAHRNEAW